MFPHKLYLYNFMSYAQGVPVLDFNQFDLACLSGPNGVGKSTLFEAITWCLWGKSRAKSDDDLIHQGQENMIVSFEFEVEGNKYKVVRKRSNKKRGHRAERGESQAKLGQGQLEFYLWQNNDWQPQSGISKSDTQKKINETLHLDYETFVNSAFLRQGHADEFTIKRAQERKTILSEILGLSHYDELQKKAKEKIKIKEIEKESLEKLIDSFQHEIKNKDALKKILVEKEKKLKESEKEVGEKEKEVANLQEEKSLLEAQKNYAQDLETKIKDNKKENSDLEEEIKQKEEITLVLNKIILKKDEIENGLNTWLDLRRQDGEFYKKFILRQKLQEEKNILERQILLGLKSKENEISKKLGLIEDKKRKLENKNKLEKEGKEIKAKFLFLEGKEREEKLLEEKIQALKQKQASYSEKIGQIQEAKKEIQENLNLLSQAQAQCPLCEQKLTLGHKNDLEKKLSKKLQELLGKQNEHKTGQQKNYLEIKNLEINIQSLKNLLKNKREIADLLSQKRHEYKLLLSLNQEIKDLEMQKNKLEEGIKNEKNKEKQSQTLKELEEKIKSISYDESSHNSIKRKKDEYEKYQKLKIQLEESEKRKIIEEKSLRDKKILLEKKEKTLQLDLKIKEKIIFSPQKLKKVIETFGKENSKLTELRKNLFEIKEGYGASKDRMSQLNLKEKELKQQREKLKKADDQISLYDEIIESLGKKGVQAMIIESVLPEIEDGANLLLSKMTEGKMQVKIFTQKEKKSDEGIQETLDIEIQDGEGMRPYEMFSGGEAFRINFAIRIALSKLLARRANAKLQFLVIDEGFGTQDVLGREYIIEAINSVRSDFKKILAITHIPELKDAFPARIEVTKDERGSHFEVIN